MARKLMKNQNITAVAVVVILAASLLIHCSNKDKQNQAEVSSIDTAEKSASENTADETGQSTVEEKPPAIDTIRTETMSERSDESFEFLITHIDDKGIADLTVERLEIIKWEDYVVDGKLYGKYTAENQETEFSVECSKFNNQELYFFFWTQYTVNFPFSNKPGLYILDITKKRLEHIAYFDDIDEMKGEIFGIGVWTSLTSDFKYLIHEYGSGPPPRGVGVWDLRSGEKILDGVYYLDINLKGNTMEVIKYYDQYADGRWFNLVNYLSEEELAFAIEYKETNKPPEDLVKMADTYSGIVLELAVLFEFNMDTRVKKIIGGKYILVN